MYKLIVAESKLLEKPYYVKLLLHTMRGIEIFQKPSYRESPMRGPPVCLDFGEAIL